MKLQDLEFESRPEVRGKRAKVMFPNGYGASVIMGDLTYGGPKGLWEVAVTDGERVVYDTPISDDVVGHCTEQDVNRLLAEIEALPKRVED